MNRFSTPRFLGGLAIAALAAWAFPAAARGEPPSPPAKRPNILYIMADDHAAHAVSAYGSRINHTPHLDRIAREGMRLDCCFCVNSICTPSRACILTGKYSHKNGVPVFNRFDGSQPTAAKYLQSAGYYTGMIGKWHLGSDPTGFDRWTILPGQGVYHDPAFLDSAGRRVIKGYVTDIITDLAIDFLKGRPRQKPFFLMCHHKAPHRPWNPDDKHFALYDEGDIPEPATLRDDYSTRSDAARETTMTIRDHLTREDLKADPPPGLAGDALLKWKYQRFIKDYLRCVASIDDNVGRLLDFLDREGLTRNTVVIYTSDQGFFLGDHGWYDKRFMYEQSIRMPFLVRWPAVIKPGTVQGAMVLNVDFAPTFLEMAGCKVPGDIQGRSFMPLLAGRRPADWRTSWYYRYYHDPGDHNTRAHYGVRTETHKLIYFWKIKQWECYDLVHDPDELHNLVDDPAHAAVVAQLKRELYRLKKEVQDNDEFADKQPPPGVDGQPRKGGKPAAGPRGEQQQPR
ncbi:MAG: sulfatase [Thermoguttaceae bacterium]|jgi:arylsulfatase A-like enzyme